MEQKLSSIFHLEIKQLIIDSPMEFFVERLNDDEIFDGIRQ
jgi:hypothetical protein